MGCCGLGVTALGCWGLGLPDLPAAGAGGAGLDGRIVAMINNKKHMYYQLLRKIEAQWLTTWLSSRTSLQCLKH